MFQENRVSPDFVIEQVIRNPISQYIESNDLFPYNMLGFRQGLSTQDAMLMIKHQIIDRHTKDVGAILALDITKAFDTVSQKVSPAGHITDEPG